MKAFLEALEKKFETGVCKKKTLINHRNGTERVL